MPRAEVRVAIVADLGLVGDALAASLAARPAFVSSGVIPPTQMDLPLRLAARRPDVVLVDADATDIDLPRCISEVFRAVPRASVVVLGDKPGVSLAVAAVRAGAAAWCDRTTSVDRLVDVILGVHHDEAWFPPTLLRAVLEELSMAAVDQSEPDPCHESATTVRETSQMVESGVPADAVRRCAPRLASTLSGSWSASPSSAGSGPCTAGGGDATRTD